MNGPLTSLYVLGLLAPHRYCKDEVHGCATSCYVSKAHIHKLLLGGMLVDTNGRASKSHKLTLHEAASESESESGYISSSHIRLIRCLAVIGQASFTREHLV